MLSEEPRCESFQKKGSLERLLAKLNRAIAVEDPGGRASSCPIVFLVGCPRSGSTLFLQWLAGIGCISYPTNFIARFWNNPVVGALVQEMLVNPRYDFRGEFFDVRPVGVDYKSDLGKTAGFLAPNEFWYFWRRFFDFGDTHELSEDQLLRVDGSRLESDLRAFASVSGKPLLLKAHLVEWHLEFLAGAVPQSKFLFLDRDPVFVMQSLLEARRRFFGDDEHWYSIRPPQYRELLNVSVYEQIGAQVALVRDRVAQQLADLPEERWSRVTYEDFCADSSAVADQINKLIPIEGLGSAPDAGIVSRNTRRIDTEEARLLRESFEKYQGEDAGEC